MSKSHFHLSPKGYMQVLPDYSISTDPSIKMNGISFQPGFAVLRSTFLMDTLSKEVNLVEDCDEGDSMWGIVIESHTTSQPIIAIVASSEELIKETLALLENPGFIIQVSETTIITRPTPDGTSIEVLQSLSTNNSILSHNIKSVNYNLLDKEQVNDLMKVQNNLYKKFHETEVENDDDTSLIEETAKITNLL